MDTQEQRHYHAAMVYTAKQTVPVGVLEGCQVGLSPVFPQE